MKSNIDLTSNEMFSRESVSLQFNFIIKHIYGLPWDMSKVAITKNDSDLIPKFEGIRTGDKRCRELKELCERESTGDYCDCCGSYLKTIPWDRTYGLCKKCMAHYAKEDWAKEDLPWGKPQEMRGQMETNPLFWD